MKSLCPVFLIASLCLLPGCATHTQAVPNTTHDATLAAGSTDVVGQPATVQDCEQGCKEEGGNRYQFYLGILSAIIGG